MRKATIIKAATLFSSICLVLVFMLFRIGVFESSDSKGNSLQSSPNSGRMMSMERDTVPVDSANLRILSSSKSIILVDPKTPPKSHKYKKLSSDSAKKKDTYLWTTKSGRIFETVSPAKDSTKSKADTIKTKGKQ
jgi:hypothetical protein